LLPGCSGEPDPDPLPLTVKQNLALLQPDPQFVMYFNFKKMRESEFWKKFISDSLFESERNFGSFLNNLREATGVSITDGIDELYFSNSWIGDNSMVIKGVFDKARVYDYISRDTLYKKIDYPGGISVYKQTETNFNFYFRDDFTVCASNYLKILENTFTVSDTSVSGLLNNTELMKSIGDIIHKENIWMVTNQQLFIRGIFENFSEIDISGNDMQKSTDSNDINHYDDTTQSMQLYNVYKSIQSLSISFLMTDELQVLMQSYCEDNSSAGELKNRMDAIFALAKLSTAFTKKPAPVIRILEKIDTEVYDRTVYVSLKFTQEDINEIRKQRIF
jgi:hypothetical protein